MNNSALPMTLSEILAPLTMEEFLTSYWGRRPLFIKGHKTKFAGVFDRERFDRALTRPRANGEPAHVRATFDARASAPGMIPELVIKPSAVAAAYKAGATCCVSAVHEHDAELALFIDSLRAELGYPGTAQVNAYYSPDGCGFGLHFDARIATTLQLDGSKWWTFSSAPAVAWPSANAAADAGGRAVYVGGKSFDGVEWAEARPFADSEFTEVLLEPGDVLMLPAGTWHKARAEGHSLAINVGFNPLAAWSFVAEILRHAFEHDPKWRSCLPIGGGRDERADAHLAACVAEAVELLQSLSPAGALVRRAQGELVMNSCVPPLPRGPGQKQQGTLAPTDEVCLTRGRAVHLHEVDGGATLALYIGDASVEVRGDSRTFLRALVAKRSFVAGEAGQLMTGQPPPWLELRATLEGLIDAGVLEKIG